MTRRYGLIVRLLGLALLLLAVSPLTAPFSTLDPLDLFGGATAPSPTAVQSKIQTDDPAAELGAGVGFGPRFFAGIATSLVSARNSRGATPLVTPLRL